MKYKEKDCQEGGKDIEIRFSPREHKGLEKEAQAYNFPNVDEFINYKIGLALKPKRTLVDMTSDYKNAAKLIEKTETKNEGVELLSKIEKKLNYAIKFFKNTDRIFKK